MVQDHSLAVLGLLLLLAASLIQAAFTRPALWKLDHIEKTYAGTWCFHPGPNPSSAPPCTNTALSALLNIHLHNDLGPGLSIAFYDLADLTVLGGAEWANWEVVALPVGVCLSGLVDGLDNTFSTTCRFTVTDDDQDTLSAHAEECTIKHPQLHVTDGCYTPPAHRPWFRLDDSASGVLAIIGLILALPIFGIYRWYCGLRAPQQKHMEDGQELPLVGLRGGAAAVSAVTDQGVSLPEPARSEGRMATCVTS